MYVFVNNVLPFAISNLYNNKSRAKVSFVDGEKIGIDILDHIQQNIEKIVYEHKWEKGDLLILDNHIYLHGRNKVTDDQRRILICMSG